MILTNQIRKAFVALPLLSLFAGCGAPTPAGPSPDEVAAGKQAKADLSSKLQEMPADKRAEYLKQHPDEVNKVMRGTGLGMSPHRSPATK